MRPSSSLYLPIDVPLNCTGSSPTTSSPLDGNAIEVASFSVKNWGDPGPIMSSACRLISPSSCRLSAKVIPYASIAAEGLVVLWSDCALDTNVLRDTIPKMKKGYKTSISEECVSTNTVG